jgi:hypothetical protein
LSGLVTPSLLAFTRGRSPDLRPRLTPTLV